MTKNILSNYIAHRIKAINDIGDIKRDSDIIHQSFFDVLLEVSFYHLAQGNTIICINDNFNTLIAEYFNSFIEMIDFDIYQKIAELLTSEDRQLKTLVDDYQKELSDKLILAGKDKVDINAIPNKLLSVLRAIYFFDKKLNKGEGLWEKLGNSGFFYTLDYQNINTAFESPKPFIAQKTDDGIVLWLYRSWYAEYQLANKLSAMIKTPVATQYGELSDNLKVAQRQAVIGATASTFAMITGGPGTGKTFTVAQLVLTLLNENNKLRLALVAPTGKAAKRMQESLANNLKGQDIKLPEAMTIHRLLGLAGDGVVHFDESRPLPYEVIIVDEASMLGAELAAKLLAAVDKTTRLILLGDVYQLSAVEAGAVLSDLCQTPILMPYHFQLTESQRFNEKSGVGKLATLINDAEPKTFEQFEKITQKFPAITFLDSQKNIQTIYEYLINGFMGFFKECQNHKDGNLNHTILADLFATLNKFRILTASHNGQLGDESINEMIKNHHLSYQKISQKNPPIWYHGRVVMITKNSYQLGLYNGDTGICLNDNGELKVYFETHHSPIMPMLLPEENVVDAYALTIHKSQGSEFEKVAICFDESNQRLLGRELIYTAVTRAKEFVEIYSTKQALMYAMNTPTVRYTGLKLIFENLN